MNIQIWLLIDRTGVCSIWGIPIRNRIHSGKIPYEPNNNRISQRVKNSQSSNKSYSEILHVYENSKLK